MSAGDLDMLADEAARKNASLGLTGFLAYNGLNFMQLLEGDAGPVNDTMSRIKEDRRHSGVIVIRKETVAERECPDWSMRARITPLDGLGAPELLTEALPGGFRPETRQLFMSFATLIR